MSSYKKQYYFKIDTLKFKSLKSLKNLKLLENKENQFDNNESSIDSSININSSSYNYDNINNSENNDSYNNNNNNTNQTEQEETEIEKTRIEFENLNEIIINTSSNNNNNNNNNNSKKVEKSNNYDFRKKTPLALILKKEELLNLYNKIKSNLIIDNNNNNNPYNCQFTNVIIDNLIKKKKDTDETIYIKSSIGDINIQHIIWVFNNFNNIEKKNLLSKSRYYLKTLCFNNNCQNIDHMVFEHYNLIVSRKSCFLSSISKQCKHSPKCFKRQ